MSAFSGLKQRELVADTMVHVAGIPVILMAGAKVATNEGNWPLISNALRLKDEDKDAEGEKACAQFGKLGNVSAL